MKYKIRTKQGITEVEFSGILQRIGRNMSLSEGENKDIGEIARMIMYEGHEADLLPAVNYLIKQGMLEKTESYRYIGDVE